MSLGKDEVDLIKTDTQNVGSTELENKPSLEDSESTKLLETGFSPRFDPSTVEVRAGDVQTRARTPTTLTSYSPRPSVVPGREHVHPVLEVSLREQNSPHTD